MLITLTKGLMAVHLINDALEKEIRDALSQLLGYSYTGSFDLKGPRG